MRIVGIIEILKRIKKVHGNLEVYLLGKSGLEILDEMCIENRDGDKVLVFSICPKIGG